MLTNLESVVRHNEGADDDIKHRLSKAKNAFKLLNNVWRSQQNSIKTKLKLYKS